MGLLVKFNRTGYEEALEASDCNPPRANAPFINVDPARYHNIYFERTKLDSEQLIKRLGEKEFKKWLSTISLMIDHAKIYFPAFPSILNEFVNEEWLSSVDWHKKFHRDHISHQAMTVYVGYWLLKGKYPSSTKGTDFEPNGKSLLEHCIDVILNPGPCDYLRDYLGQMGATELVLKDNAIARMAWESIILDTFFLAALFHDLGYPWQFVNRINSKLNDNNTIVNPSGQGVDWIADRYGKRLVFYPLHGYRKTDPTTPAQWHDRFKELILRGLTETHGLPGAISFLHLNDILRLYPENDAYAMSRFCVEWAAMAIMMHDMSSIYRKGASAHDNPQLRLRFSRDPLSSILTLSDIIQDFCRPDARFHNIYPEGEEYNVGLSYESRCNGASLDWDGNLGKLTISHYYENLDDYLDNIHSFAVENNKKYFDRNNGYLDFSDVGINEIEIKPEYGKI